MTDTRNRKPRTKEEARQLLLDDMEVARGLECSFCGAAPLEECTWPLGKSKAIHAARMPRIELTDLDEIIEERRNARQAKVRQHP